MSKQEFLRRLKEDLTSFNEEELRDALKYYDEYFKDSHEEEVEQAIEDYNVMEDIAEQMNAAESEPVEIKAENPARPQENVFRPKIEKPKKTSKILIIVLLICFSPMLIPLVIGVASAAFGLLMFLLGISITLGTAAIGGFVAAGAGAFAVGYGITQLFLMNISGALYHISVGLVCTGAGILLACIFGKLTFLLVKTQFKCAGYVGKKILRHGA